MINEIIPATQAQPFVTIRAMYHVELIYPACPELAEGRAATDPQPFATPQEAAFAALVVANSQRKPLRLGPEWDWLREGLAGLAGRVFG